MEGVLKAHVGHIREINEDSGVILSKENDTTILAIVADGMGGHQAGDVASQMTIDKMKEAFEKVNLEKDAAKWEDWLLKTIQETNHAIYQYAMNNDPYYGMGTTIVAALFLEDFYLIAHVGDSRLYRFSENNLQLMTEDHSLVHELVRSGQITEEEAEYHPQRNVITRALGTESEVRVDIQTLSYLGGELILLCSDGLTNMVKEQHIIEMLSIPTSLEEKASMLIQKALDAGGDDNVTLILVESDGDQIEGK